MTPDRIAHDLLARYDLQTALSRTDSLAVRAAIRFLAWVRPEIPVRRVSQPAAIRV